MLMPADIHLLRPSELTPDHWKCWEALQAAEPAYASPFFHPKFTRAVAAVRRDVEVTLVGDPTCPVGFFPFQRGRLHLGRPIGGKLSDYHGPLLAEGTAFDPQSWLRRCRLASWDFDHLVCSTDAFGPWIVAHAPSPQLDLSQGFAAYVQTMRQAGNDSILRQGQKTRKMVREVGTLRFEYDCRSEAPWQALVAWKSAQLRASGLPDLFAFEWVNNLFVHLREESGPDFSAPLTVLWAGEQIAAVLLSLRCRGVLHSWFTAYNPELARYSPGIALFLALAEQAPNLGIDTIDLGRGTERYKFSLASRTATVAEGSLTVLSVGTALRSAWRHTRDWAARSPLTRRLAEPSGWLAPLRRWWAYS
jgi:CelD/BcsL family acetyltransferase involved in cellulose biosynthesis